MADSDDREQVETVRHPPERLLMLVDGVFAISMTLLVIDVGIPDDIPNTAAGFATALPDLLRRLAVFVAAFVLTSRFWLVNHKQMARLHHVDDGVLGRTIFFLAGICSIPVATGVLFRFADFRRGVTFAACVLTITAILGARLWWYISAPQRDLTDVGEHERRHVMIRNVLVVAIYLLAVPIAWLLPEGRATVAPLVWLLLAAVDHVANLLDRRFNRA